MDDENGLHAGALHELPLALQLGQTLVATSYKHLWLLLLERSNGLCDSSHTRLRADQRNRGECDGQVSCRMDIRRSRDRLGDRLFFRTLRVLRQAGGSGLASTSI